MPKRPHSHELEKASRNRLHEIFTETGWVVWDLQPDYGEDLLVRIFVDNTATHYSFFVQAKATDHIERYMDKSKKCITFPIDTDHIEYWGQFWEPVILTVWDAKSNITYWESIQKYLEEQSESKSKQKNVHVNIPTDNILDKKGVKHIARYTKSRYIQNERGHEAAEVFKEMLEDALKAKIIYSPKNGMISIRHANGELYIVFYGTNNPTRNFIEQLSDEDANKILQIGFDREMNVIRELEETGKITLRDKDGNIVETYETYEDYSHRLDKWLEMKKYGFE